MDGGGWKSYWNSLKLGALTALFGTTLVFTGAYLVEKTPRFAAVRIMAQFLALLPLAVPGLVLGLGYIFFFNARHNPLNFIYGTMTILVICTISHFYSVAHLTAVTALKQIDNEFETVSASLRVPVWRTFFRVTLPVGLPAVLDIALYLFVNAMTTVSALVFLYSPDTTLAAIAVLNMDDAGDIAPAAAMATLIILHIGGDPRYLHCRSRAAASPARRPGACAEPAIAALRRRDRRRRHLRPRACAGRGAARQARRRDRPRRPGERRLDPQFRLRHGHRPAARQTLGARHALARRLGRGAPPRRASRSCIAASPWWRAGPRRAPCSKPSWRPRWREDCAAARRLGAASARLPDAAVDDSAAALCTARTNCGWRVRDRPSRRWRAGSSEAHGVDFLRETAVHAVGPPRDRDQSRHDRGGDRDRLPGRRSCRAFPRAHRRLSASSAASCTCCGSPRLPRLAA